MDKQVSWDEAKTIISQIESLDLVNTNAADISKLFSQLLSERDVVAYKLYPGHLFYRAVKWGEKPKDYDKIIHPKKEYARRNRANGEGQQMFYASNDKMILLHELNLHPEDKIVISQWRLNQYLIFNQIGYDEYNKTTQRSTKFDTANFDPELDEFISNYIKNKFSKRVDDSNPEYYKLTNEIAKIFFLGDETFQASFLSICQGYEREFKFCDSAGNY